MSFRAPAARFPSSSRGLRSPRPSCPGGPPAPARHTPRSPWWAGQSLLSSSYCQYSLLSRADPHRIRRIHDEDLSVSHFPCEQRFSHDFHHLGNVPVVDHEIHADLRDKGDLVAVELQVRIAAAFSWRLALLTSESLDLCHRHTKDQVFVLEHLHEDAE